METKPLGGMALAVDHPATALEHLADVCALDIVQAPEGELAGRGVGCERQNLLDVQRGARGKDEGPFDHVLELADVSGPRVGHQRIHGALGHALDAPPELDLATGDVGPDEKRDVLAAIPHGGTWIGKTTRRK